MLLTHLVLLSTTTIVVACSRMPDRSMVAYYIAWFVVERKAPNDAIQTIRSENALIHALVKQNGEKTADLLD